MKTKILLNIIIILVIHLLQQEKMESLKLMEKKKVSIIYFYNKNKYWVIKDKKEKIWVSCNNKIELKKTMLFKLNKDIFQAICSENN